jgi:hypothetical protein
MRRRLREPKKFQKILTETWRLAGARVVISDSSSASHSKRSQWQMARHGTSHHTITPPLDPFIVISACTFFSFRCLFSQRYTHSTTMAEQRKAVIKNADMSEPMQQDAVDIASVALSKYNIEKVSKGLVFVWSFWIESFSHILLSHIMITGCCSIHQEGIRQEARSNVVSHRDGQFVFLKIDWARL